MAFIAINSPQLFRRGIQINFRISREYQTFRLINSCYQEFKTAGLFQMRLIRCFQFNCCSIRCFLPLESVPCRRMELIILSKFASHVECAWMQSETETGVYFITKSRQLKCVARKCKLFCQSNYYGR